jgi:hypothetical protein
MDRIRGLRRRGAAVAVALGLVALAACTPVAPPGAAAVTGLRADLTADGFAVSWHPTAAGQMDGYELQVLRDGGDWTVAHRGPTTSMSFTDEVERGRYLFRVRSAAAPGGVPGAWSSPVTAWYVVPELPVIRIETQGRAPILDRENYVPASMTLDPNGSGFAAFTGTLGIRGRGNSTWVAPKKPYRLKLDTKSPLMGIAAERDWVLLANYSDRSQLRTTAAMEASRGTDLAFTPTLRHVEVILNGRYDGVYVLTQHQEVGPDRVDITEMDDDDVSGTALTGGYRLEIDGRLEENAEPGFRTTRHMPVVVKDPDPATPEQFEYIRSYVQAFESSLYTSGFAHPVTGYRRFLDTSSFIDHYLVQELTRNQDHFFSSTFFTKERGDDLLRFGPLWDFDISIGSTRGYGPLPPEGWWARTRGAWNLRIFSDPTFVDQVEQRWAELEPHFRAVADGLLPLGQALRPSIDNDASRWGYSLEPTDTPEFLRDWLDTRLDWMDAQLSAP